MFILLLHVTRVFILQQTDGQVGLQINDKINQKR